MLEVTEEMIVDCNEMCISMGETNNNFKKILNQGKIYKQNGLTPVYILHENGLLQIIIKETTDEKKLH